MARTRGSARAFDRRLMRLAMTETRTLAGSVGLGLVVAAARIATGIAIALAIGRILEAGPSATCSRCSASPSRSSGSAPAAPRSRRG